MSHVPTRHEVFTEIDKIIAAHPQPGDPPLLINYAEVEERLKQRATYKSPALSAPYGAGQSDPGGNDDSN